MRQIAPILCLCIVLISCGPSTKSRPDPRTLNWSQILKEAHGATVTMQMWRGDPQINAYMRNYVARQLKRQFDISLRIVPGQGDEIVSAFMTEAEAGRKTSPIDMMWINGETFYQLRQIHALFGPFTGHLPNNRFIDWSDPTIRYDFQEPVDGYECPWGNVQLLLITDAAKVPHPPKTPKALAAWIHKHPGRFTFDTSFTGMSFLKSLMYAFAASPRDLEGRFNLGTYDRLRDRVFAWVRSVRKDLWRRGTTFPRGVAALNRLFANGEVDFAMSFNDSEVDDKIDNGLFPSSSTAFVLTTGTLRNSHYIGINVRSPHKAAAMVVANFLISPAAQWDKLKPSVWGDGTVLDIGRLPPSWQTRFRQMHGRSRAPSRLAIEPYARPEPAPQYMIRLAKDFRQTFIQNE